MSDYYCCLYQAVGGVDSCDGVGTFRCSIVSWLMAW